MKQPNWTRILTILLVILASFAVLYIVGSILGRFTHAILIFVLGAMTAYVLSPVVNRLELLTRTRWAAILVSYAMLAVLIFSIGVLMFTPFVQQIQSLIDNLHTPSTGSLVTMVRVERDTLKLQHSLQSQQRHFVSKGLALPPAKAKQNRAAIDGLQTALRDLKRGTLSGPHRANRKLKTVNEGRQPPNPEPQTQVPPSYVTRIAGRIDRLDAAYNLSIRDLAAPDAQLFALSVQRAKLSSATAAGLYNIMASTPILLLRSQTWLDEHGIGVDVHSRFGDAASQISNQGTNVLDNAVTILSETANTLLNVTLILIVAFYLLGDGRRLVHSGLTIVPVSYREQVWYFIESLDRVLGGYIRGQLFLSTLAGVLGGGGAAALGVPYPLLIGLMTFLLESIPVIGPLVALIPAIAISLFFMPFVTTVILLIWNIVFQQFVTNVLGPRVMGMAVGIHPLEAMAAVLVGYPIAGFLGAFLAVPVAGVLHIVVREMYAYFVLGRSLPTATAPDVPEQPELEQSQTTSSSERSTAAG